MKTGIVKPAKRGFTRLAVLSASAPFHAACVGRVSSLQLAALGPNTAVFNFAFQLFAFLGVGTTSIIASNSLRAAGLSSSAR